MKFVEMLSLSVVFCSIISSVNASGVCEIGFARQCGDNVVFSCKYTNGYVNTSSTGNVNEFADDINRTSKGAVSVDSVTREDTSANTGSYIIGDGKASCDLMCFDNLQTQNEVGTLTFDASKFCGPSVSLQFDYDSAESMKLPHVSCRNIALLKFNVSNKSEKVPCAMRGFDTNVRTGFAYNNKLSINGKTYNGTTSNVESGLCVFTENSVGNMQQFTGGKVNLGKPMKKESEIFYEKNGLSKYINKKGIPISSTEDQGIVKKISTYRKMIKAGK